MIKVTAAYTHDLCASRPNARGVWHPCCLETFYSNRASDNTLEFLSPWIPITPCHRTDSYAHIRQLRSFRDSFYYISTVTIIPPGQLRSCRRCLVCKSRSYHERFTSPYLKNKCTGQQSMTHKTKTDDAPLLYANKRAQCCVQAWKSGPVRTHRCQRPPSCMIVTAMIVTVSPQWTKWMWWLMNKSC